VLRAAAQRLESAGVSYGHGTTNAHDEAAWLVLHALGLPPDDPKPHLSRVLSTDEALRIASLIEERVRTRKPAAYLTREAWLGDYRFYVDERVIVPRSYIAELLRHAMHPWIAEPAKVRTALDLCTGSGCLAILLAAAFERARIDAADISRDALDVAARNVADYGLEKRIRLVESDLYSALAAKVQDTGGGLRGAPAPVRAGRYDLVISNPPYVREAVMRTLPAEYRREPALALAGGRDGLDLVRTIVARAPAHLEEGGLLVVEVGHNRARVEKAFPHLPFVWPLTSGGDDCVFAISREALTAAGAKPPVRQAASRVRSPRATPAGASPRRPAARSPAPASTAAAARRRRSGRASGG
jgi:ribosomal protein L3 glutamine methyltransferase